MFRQTICAGLMLTVVAGCGGSDNPPTHPVSGIVTLDGKPVEGAAVAFKPDGEGKPAGGRTDAEGKFTLTTFSANDGAMVGSYKISVTKYETSDGGMNPYEQQPEPPADNKKLTEEEEIARMESGYTEADAEGGKEEIAKNELPKQYENATSSGLTYTVVEGDNEVTLELKSK